MNDFGLMEHKTPLLTFGDQAFNFFHVKFLGDAAEGLRRYLVDSKGSIVAQWQPAYAYTSEAGSPQRKAAFVRSNWSR